MSNFKLFHILFYHFRTHCVNTIFFKCCCSVRWHQFDAGMILRGWSHNSNDVTMPDRNDGDLVPPADEVDLVKSDVVRYPNSSKIR